MVDRMPVKNNCISADTEFFIWMKLKEKVGAGILFNADVFAGGDSHIGISGVSHLNGWIIDDEPLYIPIALPVVQADHEGPDPAKVFGIDGFKPVPDLGFQIGVAGGDIFRIARVDKWVKLRVL